MKKYIKTELTVINTKVNLINIKNEEYISLTDLARYVNPEEPKIPIYSWIRNKEVIRFIGL